MRKVNSRQKIADLPLRVAIVGTNDPRNFSGGRYHATILAYAAAAAGAEVELVTDHAPAFLTDFEPLAPRQLKVTVTPNFVAQMPAGRFDWVVVIPTGIFLPEFYEACLAFAARAGARVALVNFESANWFNAMAPQPRDFRLWDYWRRTVVGGGLVLSSARTSDAQARAFYRAAEGHLRFEVWSPPINSVIARRFDGLPKDGSILAFVRPQDGHKGAHDLMRLNPSLFNGRTLRLVAGREVPPAFTAEVEAHLAKASDARLEILTRIPDVLKFRLLAQAQALLFPTRFEGFGYPPVEAAYAGAESVCFPLPVLLETVGGIANFSDGEGMDAFGAALARALAQPERRALLREAVYPFADFHVASGLLADLLLRSAEVVAPLCPRSWSVPVGPWKGVPPVPAAKVDRQAPVPPVPSRVIAARRTTAGEVLLTVEMPLAERYDTLVAEGPGGIPLPIAHEPRDPEGAFRPVRAWVLCPGGMLHRRLSLRGLRDGQPVGDAMELQVEAVEFADAARPVRCGFSENRVTGDGRFLRGWVLAARPLQRVAITLNGHSWYMAEVTSGRQDVFSKHPGYPTERIEFRAQLPDPAEPDPSRAAILCFAEDVALDALCGWLPAAKPFYPATLDLGPEAPRPRAAAPSRPTAREPAGAPVPTPVAAPTVGGQMPRRALVGTLVPADVNDTAWRGGIARRSAHEWLGAVTVQRNEALAAVTPGSVLRFANGTVRRVALVEPEGDRARLLLDGPVAPDGAGHPAPIQVFMAEQPQLPRRAFSLPTYSDARWSRGVWAVADGRQFRQFFIRTEQVQQLGIEVGTVLRFARSGFRTVIDRRVAEKDTRIVLDGPIRPMADGAPREVTVVSLREEAGPDVLSFSTSRDGKGWSRGVAIGPGAGAPAGRVLLLDLSARPPVTRGDILLPADGVPVRVLGARPASDGLEVLIDGTLDPLLAGHPATLRRVSPVDVGGSLAPRWRFPDPGYRSKDPLHLRLATAQRRSGAALLTVGQAAPQSRPRVLFVTIVPPIPANQGNRVVTRNLIRHLVGLGFDVDLVMQGWIDGPATVEEFGEHVSVITVPTPDWQSSEASRLRRDITQLTAGLAGRPQDAALAERIAALCAHYEPFHILRDETVEAARALFAGRDYAAFVCNYTHSARVAAELAAMRPLPPTCIVTHDALSRLPRSFEGMPLDTSYRACDPEAERAALDAVPGAVVVAISANEAEYFGSIGVCNQVVLCEYDAAEEMAPAIVSADAFPRRRIVFNGSANPMNVAGLDWFVDGCWERILAAVPDAKLVVCGRVTTVWKPDAKGIELLGELDRAEMVALCGSASMTINPCVAGTGLKIKTVEAACLGLPAVCLPHAIEGLEGDAARFAILAEAPDAFADACIKLLTDEQAWRALRGGALDVAATRFSAAQVYAALDAAMGWRKPQATTAAELPHPAAPEGTQPTLPNIDNPLARLAEAPGDDRAMLSLGHQLVLSGRVAVGWGMVKEVARRHTGDPNVAALTAVTALQAGEPWEAALHGAAVIAQHPASAEGYRLVARGLLGVGLPNDAAACLVAGAMAAPGDEGVLSLLEEVLLATGRAEEAARWATFRRPPLPIGEYIPFDAFRFRPADLVGWTVGQDGSLSLRDTQAAVRLALPATRPSPLDIQVDILMETPPPAGMRLDARTGRVGSVLVIGEGERAATLRLRHSEAGDEASHVWLKLRAAAEAGQPHVQVVGIMLHPV